MSHSTMVTITVSITKLEIVTGSRRLAEACGANELYKDNKFYGKDALSILYDKVIPHVGGTDLVLVSALLVEAQSKWSDALIEDPKDSVITVNIQHFD